MRRIRVSHLGLVPDRPLSIQPIVLTSLPIGDQPPDQTLAARNIRAGWLPPPFVLAGSRISEGLETHPMRKPKGEYAIQTVINAMRLLEAFSEEEERFYSRTTMRSSTSIL